MNEALKNLVLELHTARTQLAAASTERERRYELWALQNREVLEMENAARAQVKDIDALLRSAIVMDFDLTGDKAPMPGLGVRVGHRLLYDEADATKWALDGEHYDLLQIRVDAFDAICEKMAELPNFVLKEPTVTPTIAKDLHKVVDLMGGGA